MTEKSVDAVWIWRFNKSAFRATYGRFPGNTYSKDYLQAAGECGDLLSQKFGVAVASQNSREIRFQWPGGSSDGFVSYSADRFHVAWKYQDAPAPWKLSKNPSSNTDETIPGNPDHQDSTAADGELSVLESRNLDAFLVAVKLHEEDDILHIRAFLGNAPHGMEWASIDRAPRRISEAARSMAQNVGCTSLEVQGGVTAEPEVAKLIAHLDENPNVLLMGPPGTGKSVLLEKLTYFVEHNVGGLGFDPELNHDAFVERHDGKAGKSNTVVFHPAYTYDDLVVGLLPEPMQGGVGVRATPGPLVNLAHYAQDQDAPTRALLVIDEFNRGNAAAILGDTLALLDKDKRGHASISLPFSHIGVEVPSGFANQTGTTVRESFQLPPNLWIVAAMNTSDRSVAPLDAALRRRFSIIEMPPDYAALAAHLDAAEISDVDFNKAVQDWNADEVSALAVRLLMAINHRVDAVLGPDYRLGPSNFWGISGENGEEAFASLVEAFNYRILPTLRLAMQDDDGAFAAVLRSGTSDQPRTGKDLVAFWELPIDDLGGHAAPRVHVRELPKIDLEAAKFELIYLSDS